jgi:gluconate kinase
MIARTDHFMPVSLLNSQLAALEPLAADERGVSVDSGLSVSELTRAIMPLLADMRR